MPEDLDDVAGPSLTGQHAIQKLAGAVDSREYANEDLAGKGSDGREAFLVCHLHVLQIGYHS